MVTLVVPHVPLGTYPRQTVTAAPRRAPNRYIRAGAQTYVKGVGLSPIREGHYVPVLEDRARYIANCYDALPDVDAKNPAVERAYNALIVEIIAQWEFVSEKLGIRIEAWNGDGQPYQNSQEMMDDLRDSDHLFIFTGGAPHPYLKEIHVETGYTANDLFRGIHDIFGHAAEGFGFGAKGEENAWLAHSQMFSPIAQKAMTTETRGQSAWVNFGRHNYDADGRHRHTSLTDRPYATQKAALLPDACCDWQRVLDEARG